MSQNLQSQDKGFTIVELIIILVVISIMATLAIPEVLDARKDSRALMCGAALKNIEAAKSAWAREFPGAPIQSSNSLNRYFPSGMFPQDPWGIGFNNVTNLNTETSHNYNGNPSYEPRGSSAPGWLTNGYNDTGKP